MDGKTACMGLCGLIWGEWEGMKAGKAGKCALWMDGLRECFWSRKDFIVRDIWTK